MEFYYFLSIFQHMASFLMSFFDAPVEPDLQPVEPERIKSKTVSHETMLRLQEQEIKRLMVEKEALASYAHDLSKQLQSMDVKFNKEKVQHIRAERILESALFRLNRERNKSEGDIKDAQEFPGFQLLAKIFLEFPAVREKYGSAFRELR